MLIHPEISRYYHTSSSGISAEVHRVSHKSTAAPKPDGWEWGHVLHENQKSPFDRPRIYLFGFFFMKFPIIPPEDDVPHVHSQSFPNRGWILDATSRFAHGKRRTTITIICGGLQWMDQLMKDDRLHWLQLFLCCCCTGGRYESIETLSLTYWLAVHVDGRVYNFRVFAAPVTNQLSEPRASSLRYCNGFVLTRTIYGYDLPSDFTAAKSGETNGISVCYFTLLWFVCVQTV